MGLLQRFWGVFQRNFLTLKQNTEDPEQLLENTLLKMQRDLISIRQAIAGAIASEKRTQRHYLQHQEQAQSWYHRVNLAVTQNNLDLAQQALSRCRYSLEIAQNLQQQILKQKRIIHELQQNLTVAETELDKVKNKKDLYLARAKNALTAKEIQKINYEFKEGNFIESLGKMEQKVWELESYNELLNQKPLDNLEIQFQTIETEDKIQNPSFNMINLEQNAHIKSELNKIRSELEGLE
jgi:phage shock protein A